MERERGSMEWERGSMERERGSMEFTGFIGACQCFYWVCIRFAVLHHSWLLVPRGFVIVSLGSGGTKVEGLERMSERVGEDIGEGWRGCWRGLERMWEMILERGDW